MPLTLKFKRNSTTGVVPTTAQLSAGEAAINTFDGRFFIYKNNGIASIVEMCATNGTFVGTLAAVGGGSIDTIPISRGAGSITSNIAIGSNALNANTTGTNNISLGLNALDINGIGSNNTAIGVNSLGANINGNNNVAIGSNALTLSTVGNNIAIGAGAGSTATTGTNNCFLGNNALGAAAADSNTIVIGSGAVGLGNNTTVIGTSATTLTKIWGVISRPSSIVTTPSASFTINNSQGIITCGLAATITVNNSLVTTSSIIIATLRTAPSPPGLYIRTVIPAAGRFNIVFSATPKNTNPIVSFVIFGTT
jgi:hypothetical protein